MPDSSVNTPSGDFDFETEIELLDPETFLKYAGYSKIRFESGFWKFWPVKDQAEGWTEIVVNFRQDIGQRWSVTLWLSCLPLHAPLASRRQVGNLYPQANITLGASTGAIATIRQLAEALEAIFQKGPRPSEAVQAFRDLNRAWLAGTLHQYGSPIAESVVCKILEDDSADDLIGDLDLADMFRVSLQQLDIRSLRQAFVGLGYKVSAYRQKRSKMELCLTGTPSNKAHRVTAGDVQAVARYYEEYFKDIPGFSICVFGWNRKPPGPGVQDYERKGFDKLYVTIRESDFSEPTHVDFYGGLPFRDIQYEGLEEPAFGYFADLDDLLDQALSGLATAENVVEVLDRAGYNQVRGKTYGKLIKRLATGVKGLNESVEMWVLVNLTGPRSTFVYIGYPKPDSFARIGMANSWIRSLPNSLPLFLPELEAALKRCEHTDDVLTFKQKHPELELHQIAAKR